MARQLYKGFKRFNSHEEVTLCFTTELIDFEMYLTFTILQCLLIILCLLLEFYIVFSLLLHEKINDAVTFKCLKQTI